MAVGRDRRTGEAVVTSDERPGYGDALVDISVFSGDVRPWNELASRSLAVAEGLERAGELTGNERLAKAGDRMRNCGSWLTFARGEAPGMTPVRRLTGAFFCGNRLCALCAKARSDKLYAEVLQVDEELCQAAPDLVVLMLTLTDRKPWLCDLGETITERNAAFARLSKRDRFRRAVVAWLRVMEITVSDDGRAHPHFHVLLWVREQEYFGSDLFIEHAEWQSMWKQCLRIEEDYKPQVRIERLRNFREGTKYVVKDTDFVKARADGDGFEADAEVAAQLYLSTYRRRLVGWSQNLVAVRRTLGLTADGDDEPAIVPNQGFADCYTYVGDEKYCKALASPRRVEYRFCWFAPARSGEGTAIVRADAYDTG
jgi:plasmid rolling circle replication initiator protein Rep